MRIRLGQEEATITELQRLLEEKAIREQRVSKLSSELTRLQTLLDGLRKDLLTQINQLKAEIAELDKQITSLTSQIQAVQNEIIAIRESLKV